MGVRDIYSETERAKPGCNDLSLGARGWSLRASSGHLWGLFGQSLGPLDGPWGLVGGLCGGL
eukprot:9467346-Pyramimonas_sp.AAC.1